MGHHLAACSVRGLDHAARLVEGELGLVGHGTGVEVDDAGEDQFDLVVGASQLTHRTADAVAVADIGGHEGAVAFGALHAQADRSHLRQPAAGTACFGAQPVVDAVAVAAVAHHCHAMNERLGGAAAPRFSQHVERLLEVLRSQPGIGLCAVQEEVHVGIDQPGHDERGALDRPAPLCQGSGVIAGRHGRQPAILDRHGCRAGVPLFAVEPFVDDQGECVGRVHALYSLRTARMALLPVCCRKFWYALST